MREEFAFGDRVVELAEEVDVHGPGVSCVVDVVASHGGVDFDEVVGMFEALGLACIFTIGSAISFSFFFFSFSQKHESERERVEKRKKQRTQKSQQTTQRSFDSRIRSTDRQRPRHRITTGKRSSNNRQQSHIKAQIKSIHRASKEFPRRHDARVRDDVMVCHGVDGGTRSSLVIWLVGNISTLSSYITHLSHSAL